MVIIVKSEWLINVKITSKTIKTSNRKHRRKSCDLGLDNIF